MSLGNVAVAIVASFVLVGSKVAERRYGRQISARSRHSNPSVSWPNTAFRRLVGDLPVLFDFVAFEAGDGRIPLRHGLEEPHRCQPCKHRAAAVVHSMLVPPHAPLGQTG